MKKLSPVNISNISNPLLIKTDVSNHAPMVVTLSSAARPRLHSTAGAHYDVFMTLNRPFTDFFQGKVDPVGPGYPDSAHEVSVLGKPTSFAEITGNKKPPQLPAAVFVSLPGVD
jgi:hypothetical protein